MIADVFSAVVLLAVLGCGLMAGGFFAFSAGVMSALARLPPATGIAAMQAMNSAIVNPIFLAVFLGTAAACLIVMVASFISWPAPGAIFLPGGSALYLVGAMLVAIVFNIPRNEALAAVEPSSADGANVWSGGRPRVDGVEPCADSYDAGGSSSTHHRAGSEPQWGRLTPAARRVTQGLIDVR